MADDAVDALRTDLGGLLDEARQMLERAGRRERTGHREQHNLLAREEVLGRDALYTARLRDL